MEKKVINKSFISKNNISVDLCRYFTVNWARKKVVIYYGMKPPDTNSGRDHICNVCSTSGSVSSSEEI